MARSTTKLDLQDPLDARRRMLPGIGQRPRQPGQRLLQTEVVERRHQQRALGLTLGIRVEPVRQAVEIRRQRRKALSIEAGQAWGANAAMPVLSRCTARDSGFQPAVRALAYRTSAGPIRAASVCTPIATEPVPVRTRYSPPSPACASSETCGCR